MGAKNYFGKDIFTEYKPTNPVYGVMNVPEGILFDGNDFWAKDQFFGSKQEETKQPTKESVNFDQPDEDNGIVQNNDNYTSIQIKDAHRKAAQYFLDKKDRDGKSIFTPEQVAGIVGNLIQESNMNPSIVNKSSGAYGLAQWLGPRKKKLFQRYGTNPTFEQQLDFIWDELNTSELNAFKHLLNTKTSDEAADSVMNMFERPSKKERNESEGKRRNNAKSILAEIAKV